jgi:hypothetical protein
MVQVPEICDEKSEAYKAGYKTICEIGEERIRRAGDKIYSKFADQRSTINDQRSTINDQRSTINDQRSTINDQRSTINDQRSTINGTWILDSEYSNWQTAI